MRCNKARQEIIWERHHGAGSVVPFSLQAGNDIFFRFYLTKAELLALTLADLDFKENTIHITKSLQHKAGGDIVTPPKTDNGIRTITMPEAIMRELADYAHKIYGITPSDRVFIFSKSLIRGNMKRGAEKANIPFIRIHDMRHSHVSLLINMGFSPHLIAERIGDTIQMVNSTYGHLYPSKHNEVAEKLNQIIVPN